MVGPAAPLRDDSSFLADSCWLLRGRLSGGAELTYRGRPARQLRVTPVPGGEEVVLGPLFMYPADAIVDAETGCLLRLISYSGDTLAAWRELDDISTEPARPGRVPGRRSARHPRGGGNRQPVRRLRRGHARPGRHAVRAAAEAVNRTAGAVSAARSFLDDLRGHR